MLLEDVLHQQPSSSPRTPSGGFGGGEKPDLRDVMSTLSSLAASVAALQQQQSRAEQRADETSKALRVQLEQLRHELRA